jgi:hypothetical protein
MAYYRKRYSKMTGKWTPVAAVGKTLSTRKIAERIEGVVEVERNANLV